MSQRARIIICFLSALLVPAVLFGQEGGNTSIPPLQKGVRGISSPPTSTSLAAVDPAAEWLSYVSSCQKSVYSLRARFVEERKHWLQPVDKRGEGFIELRRGGRLRLEYEKPSTKLIVSDGVALVAYDKAEKSAFATTVKQSLLSGVFEFFLGTGETRLFDARYLGGGLHPGAEPAAIELCPRKKDPFVQSIVLTVTDELPCVRRVLIVDRRGAVTRVDLSNIETNVGLGKDRFTFKPPRGVDVVEP